MALPPRVKAKASSDGTPQDNTNTCANANGVDPDLTLEECLADSSSSSSRPFHKNRSVLILVLIILVGAGSFASILGLGIKAAHRDQESRFEQVADDLLHKFESALVEYEVAALWLHQACFAEDLLLKSHEEVHSVYRYLLSTGLEFQAVSFAMNVTHEERPATENATRDFITQNHPDVKYEGFSGLYIDQETGSPARGARTPQPCELYG